jgi:hypothetical protein
MSKTKGAGAGAGILSDHTEAWGKLLPEVSYRKTKKSLPRKVCVVWEAFWCCPSHFFVGRGVEKRLRLRDGKRLPPGLRLL